MTAEAESVQRRLAAILAADVVGYSRLMEANEEGTLAALNRHRREFFDPTIAKHGGRIFKAMGDGFLVEFASVLKAARCALEIQKGMIERNAGIPEDRHIRFRIGINLDDIIVEGDDVFGDGVNLAVRLEGLAAPGGIACSAIVQAHIATKLEAEFLDQGEKSVKNFDQPVHVYFIGLAPGQAANSGAGTASNGIGRLRSDKPSIAILPFANMSNDTEQEFFSDGITEDIITDLSKVSGLFVLGRNTVFTYKGKAVNLEQIARELGVAYLLEGSVRKAGRKVRINAQLIEGATGGHIWAERFDRDLTDIFALQDEITHAIVDQLKVKLLPEEKRAIAQAPTGNVEAYTYYLRGRELFHRGSRTYYAMAKRMFAKAIELDPQYARAYAGTADCESFLLQDYSENVSVESVLATCAKALELDGGLAEARASRGLALAISERYADAETEFTRAIAINPNLFEAHYFFGRTCYVQGKLEDALRHWERASEVKPDDYQSLLMLRQVYDSLGRKSDMREAARRGFDRAERALAQNPDNARPVYLGAGALAVLGEVSRAKEWAARAMAIDPDDVMTQYNVACLHAHLGERELALDLLVGLLPRAHRDTKAWVLQDTDFAPLRDHPRWQQVLELAR